MSDLSKAWKDGERGKYRRVDGGKIAFIRSKDGKVMKTEESDAVHETDTKKACWCGEKGCTKHLSKGCLCKHEGVCKGYALCKCECEEGKQSPRKILDDLVEKLFKMNYSDISVANNIHTFKGEWMLRDKTLLFVDDMGVVRAGPKDMVGKRLEK